MGRGAGASLRVPDVAEVDNELDHAYTGVILPEKWPMCRISLQERVCARRHKIGCRKGNELCSHEFQCWDTLISALGCSPS